MANVKKKKEKKRKKETTSRACLDAYVCQCPAGLSGRHCEFQQPPQAADACAARPCHAGQCVAYNGHFVCQCPPGHSGQRCENREPCAHPQPCQNGGRCAAAAAAASGYTCQCAAGFAGKLLERLKGGNEGILSFISIQKYQFKNIE